MKNSSSPRRILRALAHWWYAAGPFLALAVSVYVFGFARGPAPALVKFLNPVSGAWVTPDDDLKRLSQGISIPGLKAPVTVHFDKNRIPHVFAQNDDDLYATQGFLVAADRLWQMEFIARVADGRLSEVFGARTLEFDRMFVKLGVPSAADESLAEMMQDDFTRRALESYARGVNAYIARLKPHELPFEYKLTETQPEPWTTRKTALLQKFMAYNLSFWSSDLSLSRSFTRVSETDFAELFALDFPIPAPIIPNRTNWKFKSLAPQPPAKLHHAASETVAPLPTPHPSNGSNNWAVAGTKSTTGRPIVANDVHLGYSLPSLWYEMQLVSPNQNVYGATIPGAPGVLLGFNSKVAWAVTNAGTDIIDWFEMRFRDESRAVYEYDGEWRPIITRDHEIKIKGLPPEKVTIRKTHFGPLVYEESESPVNPTIPRGLAMRWGALDASNDLRSFLLLNRSTDFASCRTAIEHHSTPAQNFICADVAGDIGIFHQGRFPVRWKEQGRMISDGGDPIYDWHGFLPREEIPMLINPKRGFVSSANQPPTDSRYPHYIGWPFEVPYRGQRINEILESKPKFSPEDLIAMQSDTLLIPAREVLNVLLEHLPKDGLTELQESARLVLTRWDYRTHAASAATAIFETWWKNLESQIWSDHFPDPRQFFVPRRHRTIHLILTDPDSKWFDRIETDDRETLNSLVQTSYLDAVEDLRKKYGKNVENWRWDNHQKTEFPHLARIPGLGSPVTNMGGHSMAVLANRGEHGPVWKTVVALGETGKQWAIYPGGQSGHPASRHYDNFLKPWSKGEMRKIEYLVSKEERPTELLQTLELLPAGATR